MIGVNTRIIVFAVGLAVVSMINPVITKKSGGSYEAEEGCLSLPGTCKTIRYNKITAEYEDITSKNCLRTYSGFAAQIIQHENDHCDGTVI